LERRDRGQGGGRNRFESIAHLENPTGFFVDQARDTFDTASTSKSTDGWLGDTLDVVSQDLTMTWKEGRREIRSRKVLEARAVY
jgi:hypothetical protein